MVARRSPHPQRDRQAINLDLRWGVSLIGAGMVVAAL
jgi:hypothetical protein